MGKKTKAPATPSAHPWRSTYRFTRHTKTLVIEDASGSKIATVHAKADDLRAQANGRAMAAAPEMLAKLRQIKELLDAVEWGKGSQVAGEIGTLIASVDGAK